MATLGKVFRSLSLMTLKLHRAEVGKLDVCKWRVFAKPSNTLYVSYVLVFYALSTTLK